MDVIFPTITAEIYFSSEVGPALATFDCFHLKILCRSWPVIFTIC